jgi:retron-type reverse transcriptase
VTIGEKFKFKDTDDSKTFSKINSLDPKKSCMKNDIPIKFLLGTNDIICKPLANIYNTAKNSEQFPSSLKTADVTPLPKDREKDNKNKYRPVTLTPILSKIFEKDMYEQISEYVDKFLSPYLFGYRRGHSSEQCLMTMIEMWRKALDEGKVAGAVLTDLSKAFDCLPHNLLIAKLHAYGFEKSALNFIQDYLTERTQRTKVDGEYSKKRTLKYGVPQGSILGPLLFNLFINDIFYFINESKLANYADDTSIYISKEGIFPFLHALKSETSIVLNWFKTNEMKSNSDKCHLIVAENEHRPAYISNACIYLDEEKELLHSEKTVKPLGIWIDNKMTFEEHVKTLLKVGNQKLHALMRVSKYMNEEKLKLLMTTFIQSQFNYCPRLWMFHSRNIITKD